jgi:protein-L-isoaspartate(D-aspartate) O-methyltransferase
MRILIESRKTNVKRTLLLGSLGLIGSSWVLADFSMSRLEMVRKQIEARGVHDVRVLEAMKKIPRHKFVPEKIQEQAYSDRPLPIGEDQTISQPYIVALMSQLLELKGNEKVLEIGTGSGYQAAVLAELAKEVYTIEIIPILAERADKILDDMGYGRISIKQGDGYQGWPEKAPFDAIIVTCAPTKVPKPLQEQLKEGGRMVIPVGRWPNQTLYHMVKRNGILVEQPVIPVLFVPMTGTPT